MKTFEVSSSGLSDYLQNPTDSDSEYAQDTYDHLAGFCVQAFCNQYSPSQEGSARGGFRVMSRLLKFAARLYPEHTETNDLELNVDGLRDILLESVETPLRFAAMSNRTSAEAEGYFGLTMPGIPSNLADLYQFEPNTVRGTIFIADDEHFYSAVTLGMDQDSSHGSSKRCPMMELTRKVFWPGIVNLAADTPEIFAHDLGVVDN